MDEKYIVEAHKAKRERAISSRILLYGSLAACLCLFYLGVQLYPVLTDKPSCMCGYAYSYPEVIPMSQKYETLKELLEGLKDTDVSSEAMGSGSVSINAVGTGTDETSTVLWDKLYSIDHSDPGAPGINVYDTADSSGQPCGRIDTDADSIIGCGRKLAAIKHSADGGGRVELYEAYGISNPRLSDTVVVNGTINSCFAYRSNICVVFSGETPIGEYNGNSTEFLPTVAVSGAENKIKTVNILGEPNTTRWTALAMIKPIGMAEEFVAFYGDIETIYLDSSEMAIETRMNTETLHTQADLFFFTFNDASVIYSGRLSCAEAFSLEQPDPAALDGEGVDTTDIISVNFHASPGDLISVIGVKCHYQGSTVQTRREELFALNYKPRSMNRYAYAAITPFGDGSLKVDEVTWNQQRCIVTASTLDQSTAEMTSSFITADFSNRQPTLELSDASVKHISGIKDIWAAGTIFGKMNALVPLPDGKYLRYNDTSDGFDLYSFSEGIALEARDVCTLTGGERFEALCVAYPDGQHIGAAVVVPGSRGYADASLIWRKYSFDGKSMTPVSEFVITDRYEQSVSGINILSCKGQYYLVSTNDSKLTILS